MPRSLEALLERGGPGEIALLGKADFFTEEEIARALERQGFIFRRGAYSEASLALVESRRMTPLEEQMSESARDKGVACYPMLALERWMSTRLRRRETLMALKLSADRERLLRLLRNEYLDDEFFLELFKLYRWESNELMESDSDRLVLIALMERFLQLSLYERDALYSPATLLRLIRSTTDPRLLDALLDLPAFEFRQKRGKLLSIAEAVAQREILSYASIERLIKRRDPLLDRVLAANPALDASQRRRLFERANTRVREALAGSPVLEEELFDELLNKEPSVVEGMLRFQPIDEERLEKIFAYDFDEESLALLGENERLDTKIYPRLLLLEIAELTQNLAANDATPPEVLEELAQRKTLHPYLATNPATPKGVLRRLYAGGKEEVLEALAYNPSTPVEILKELYKSGEFALYQGLAINPATPMEILHQLKTDHRLWLLLQRNETFVQQANREMGMR